MIQHPRVRDITESCEQYIAGGGLWEPRTQDFTATWILLGRIAGFDQGSCRPCGWPTIRPRRLFLALRRVAPERLRSIDLQGYGARAYKIEGEKPASRNVDRRGPPPAAQGKESHLPGTALAEWRQPDQSRRGCRTAHVRP